MSLHMWGPRRNCKPRSPTRVCDYYHYVVLGENIYIYRCVSSALVTSVHNSHQTQALIRIPPQNVRFDLLQLQRMGRKSPRFSLLFSSRSSGWHNSMLWSRYVASSPSNSLYFADDFLGGWANEGKFEFYKEINAQIDQAFENVQSALTAAGGKGWDQVSIRSVWWWRLIWYWCNSKVFRVNSYHVPLNNEALEAMVRNFRKWMPNHQPLWTCVGVTRLGEDDMRVEIEVQAYDPVKKDWRSRHYYAYLS